jgi:polar amino acid transport system substrate-binding protein
MSVHAKNRQPVMSVHAKNRRPMSARKLTCIAAVAVAVLTGRGSSQTLAPPTAPTLAPPTPAGMEELSPLR